MSGRRTSGNDVLVLEQHTLGRAGGSAGVHDACQVLTRGWRAVDGRCLSLFPQLVEALYGDLWMVGLELLNVLFVDAAETVVDDMLELTRELQGLVEFREQVRVEEDGLGIGLLQRMGEAFLAKRVVGGDNSHVVVQGAVRKGEPERATDGLAAARWAWQGQGSGTWSQRRCARDHRRSGRACGDRPRLLG